jgi:site-specific DNA-cytosine methylase
LQRHIEASGKARKGVAADAESSVARCITTGEMKRQDYETCTMIAQPVPFTKSKRAQSVTDDETWVDGQVNPTLSLFDQGDTRATTVAVAQDMTVRRLSPREFERLQGFPDDYTLIPWRKKQAEDCPDGPRYRALGNSMAVNCMSWIGERIAAYEATP